MFDLGNTAMLPDGGDVCLLASDVFACRQKRCALTRRCVSSTRCDSVLSLSHCDKSLFCD